jgi:hypothetical protein
MAASDAAREALVLAALDLHRRKGTPWAVRELFRVIGLGEIEIVEGRGGWRRDGQRYRDGFAVRGSRPDLRSLCRRDGDRKRDGFPVRSTLPRARTAWKRDGFRRRDGFVARGASGACWPWYLIEVQQPLSAAQIALATSALEDLAPARSRLYGIFLSHQRTLTRDAESVEIGPVRDGGYFRNPEP